MNANQLRDALGKVVDAYWSEVFSDFEKSSFEDRIGHLFLSFHTLNSFLILAESLDEDGVSFDLIAGNAILPGSRRTLTVHRIVVPDSPLLTYTPDTPVGVNKAVSAAEVPSISRCSFCKRAVNKLQLTSTHRRGYQQSTTSTPCRK